MSGNQLNNLQLLDASPPYGLRSQESSDVIQQDANWEFNADVKISGTLTTLSHVEQQVEQVRVEDNHLYLNQGYETAAAQTGGLVVNYLPTATTDTVAATGFVAGVPATSNPTVITVGSGTFSAGDFIQITGADDIANNGLYEVLSHTGTTLTIEGVGTSGTTEDFTEDQFTTDTTVSGTITKVTVAVLRAGTDGVWETASGSTSGLSFSDLTTGGSLTLQNAYDNDPDGSDATITTSGTDGAVIIAGSEKLQVSATGGLDVDTVADFDVTTFDVQMTGSNGFSLDGTAASNATVTAGNLTLATLTSGNVVIDAVDLLNIDAGANIDIDVTGTFDVLATSTFSIDGTGNSNVSVDTGDLTLATTSSGALLLSSAGEIDLTGQLIDINAAANLDIDVTGTYDMLATGAFSIDGTGASNLTADSGNLTLSTTTSGQLILTSAGDMDINIPANSGTAANIGDGSNTYFNFDSTTAFPTVDLGKFMNITDAEGLGIELTTDSALVAGDLVHVKATTGNVDLADANAGSLVEGTVVGVSRGTFGGASTAQIITVPGSLVPVRFASAPAAADNGKFVYASTTPGVGSTAPPSGNDVVIYKIGVLQGADGADTTPTVIFQPEFFSRGPQVT